MTLLEVKNLEVEFGPANNALRAVRGLSFHVDRGETLGIVGESGAGKSVALQAVVGLVREARVSGTACFNGVDLLTMDKSRRRKMLGKDIAFVFQDPQSSLHPLYKVGWQISELLRAHITISRSAARQRTIDLLGLVGIPSPERRVDDYPHQFSGGMRQRAMIAMAIALDPALLIADEPTTALDVTIQAEILDLLARLQSELGMGIIIVTHDLGVIAEIADRVSVMYAGKQVERADVETIFHRPHHPYTQGLLASLPSVDNNRRLVAIAGQPPNLSQLPSGCAFYPRCSFAMEQCSSHEPPITELREQRDHASACWLASDEFEPGAHGRGSAIGDLRK